MSHEILKTHVHNKKLLTVFPLLLVLQICSEVMKYIIFVLFFPRQYCGEEMVTLREKVVLKRFWMILTLLINEFINTMLKPHISFVSFVSKECHFSQKKSCGLCPQ